MKRVCAWCKCDMGTAPGPADQITHGICEPCRERHFKIHTPAQIGRPAARAADLALVPDLPRVSA